MVHENSLVALCMVDQGHTKSGTSKPGNIRYFGNGASTNEEGNDGKYDFGE